MHVLVAEGYNGDALACHCSEGQHTASVVTNATNFEAKTINHVHGDMAATFGTGHKTAVAQPTALSAPRAAFTATAASPPKATVVAGAVFVWPSTRLSGHHA